MPQGGAETGSVRERGQADPTIEQLRAEAMKWGRKPRRLGAWYVTEHM
ncbi:ABC transporter permease, partial [Acinetobacter baumannii]|nr:ABC transporter permease [Acinetobacter baumannii]